MKKVSLLQEDASIIGVAKLDQLHTLEKIGTEDVQDFQEPLEEEMNTHIQIKTSIRDAMKIDMILQEIFRFCFSKTLANCRLVCKQWNDVSLKDWRKKAVLCTSKKLEDGNSLQEYFQLRNDDESLQLRRHPFRNFRIGPDFPEYLRGETNPISSNARHVILRDINGPDYKDLEMFLSKFNILETLELQNCTWGKPATRQNRRCQQDNNEGENDTTSMFSVSLKRLKIYRTNDTRIPHLGNSDFILRLPNVEAVSLELVNTSIDFSLMENTKKLSDFAGAIWRRSQNKDNVTPLNLKELEIIITPILWKKVFDYDWNFWNRNFLEPILNSKLPLERLVLDLMWDRTIDMKKLIRSLFNLLDFCSKSLLYLRTSFHFVIEDFMDFVYDECQKERPIRLISALTPVRGMTITMEALKEVKLANGIWAFFLLAHLELPNLEKLTVEYGKSTEKVKIHQYQMHHLTGKVFPRLETFELLDYHEIPGKEMMTFFGFMMPNLIHLSVPLDKQGFQFVCEKFKGLRTLNVLPVDCQYATLDDESLTGVANDGKEDSPSPRRPNITDLASLTDLTISSDSAFTDHTVIHGFLQLPRLHFLKVSFDEISDEIKAKLMKHVSGNVDILQKRRKKS